MAVAELEAKVKAQGDKVRELKGKKAPKADVDAAVQVLLSLKKDLAAAGGAPAPAGKKDKKKSKEKPQENADKAAERAAKKEAAKAERKAKKAAAKAGKGAKEEKKKGKEPAKATKAIAKDAKKTSDAPAGRHANLKNDAAAAAQAKLIEGLAVDDEELTAAHFILSLLKGEKPKAPIKKVQAEVGPVVCRFAPSPTGYLHIGGARIALLNWLFARHHGGKMLLRIEDTDESRHNEAAVDAIVQGMKWLGCDHDGEIIRQGERKKRHQEIVGELLKNGGAYKCYCSKELLDEQRAEAEANKVPFRYPRTCLGLKAPPSGAGDPVIRVKVNKDKEVTVEDRIQGSITVANTELDDFIILRADGSPTYLHAVVVDDHDMEVTHVVRGTDHITNTFRQIVIYEAMGWKIPAFAHVPLVLGNDGKKLSKRHGATGLEQYASMGYLPEAMRNYLVKLGWSHGDDEKFSTEQAIEWFGFEGCSRSMAQFDMDKLDNLNSQYIREADDTRILDLFLENFPELKHDRTRLNAAMPMLKPRARTVAHLKEVSAFLYASRPLELDAKAQKQVNAANKANVKKVTAALEGLSEWTVDTIQTPFDAVAEQLSLKLGKLAQPVRAALTGTVASPGIYEVLWILGKEESLARLRDFSS